MSKLSMLDEVITSNKFNNTVAKQQVYKTKGQYMRMDRAREELGSFERSDELKREWDNNPFG